MRCGNVVVAMVKEIVCAAARTVQSSLNFASRQRNLKASPRLVSGIASDAVKLFGVEGGTRVERKKERKTKRK